MENYNASNSSVDISIMEILSEGWEYFKKDPWMIIAGVLIYYAISFVLGFIPIINIIAYFIVLPPLVGGLILYFLTAVKGEKLDLNYLFAGFSKFGTLLGAYWLIVAIALLCLLPTIIYAFITVGFTTAIPAFPLSLIVVYFLNLIAAFYFLIKFQFVFFVIMDNQNIAVMDAFKKSAEMVEGNRWTLIGYAIVSFFFMLIGYLLLIIPGIIVSMVVFIGMGRLYLKLKVKSSPVVHTMPNQPPPESIG